MTESERRSFDLHAPTPEHALFASTLAEFVAREVEPQVAQHDREERFNLASRLVASALFMLFHVGRVAIVLYLPALALSSATDINIYVAILAIGWKLIFGW